MSPRFASVLVALALGCGTQADGAPSAGATPATVRPAGPTIAEALAPPIGRVDRTATVTAAGIASRVGDRGAADASPKHARLGEPVTLYAVIEAGGAIYSDAPALRWRGKTVTPRPLADAPRVTLGWRKVEPTEANLSNTATGAFRYEAIPYATTALAGTGAALVADVRPTRTPDHGGGAVGTMRYQVVVQQGDRTVASPGIDARRGRGAGGLSDDVHRVTIRRDDSFLGYLTEMYGQPYIWASAGGTARTHQSERLEGSDCADLMVYGARRAGLDIPYGYTGSLSKVARTLARGDLADDGIYRDAAGKPVPFTRPGDLVLFPRHVGALYQDRGTLGVVDVDDVMIHTLFDSPKEQAIRDSGYAENPISILRWKGL